MSKHLTSLVDVILKSVSDRLLCTRIWCSKMQKRTKETQFLPLVPTSWNLQFIMYVSIIDPYSQLTLQLSPEKDWQYKSLSQVFCPLALSTTPLNTQNCSFYRQTSQSLSGRWIWKFLCPQMTGLWFSLLSSKLRDGMDFSLMNMWWSLKQLLSKKTNTSQDT